MPELSAIDSPALNKQSPHYPSAWNGQVPLRVRAAETVYSDFPWLGRLDGRDPLKVIGGSVYEVYVNSHGAVSAITKDGLLGLKPAEFEVVDWHRKE